MIVLLCGGSLGGGQDWRTYDRLLFATKLAADRREPLLISSGVAGGQRQSGQGGLRPESWEYAQYAIRELGFREEQLFIEDISRDTVGNALFSKIFMRSKPELTGTKVTWVTNAFHQPRLARILEKTSVDTDGWSEIIATIPDSSNHDLMKTLHEHESNSLNRFNQDFGATAANEMMTKLFEAHDFYKAITYRELCLG